MQCSKDMFRIAQRADADSLIRNKTKIDCSNTKVSNENKLRKSKINEIVIFANVPVTSPWWT